LSGLGGFIWFVWFKNQTNETNQTNVLYPSLSSMNRLLVAMLRTIIGIVLGGIGLVAVGCTGWTVPQQPRLEIAESARHVIVRPHSLFFSTPYVTLARDTDGTLRVQSFSTTAEKWAHQDLSPDHAMLDHLHDALLPFLVPACETAPR
jgi:hypothetical protein